MSTKLATNLTQPLKWHGGKYYLRHWIIENMPPHLHYVEPFFGGGTVLLARDPNRDWLASETGLRPGQSGSSEVVNDLHRNLTNFWRVLQDPTLFETFYRRLQVTPFSELEFEAALASMAEPAPESLEPPSLERAIQFFIVARQSRQGLQRDYATLSRNRTRRKVNEQASAWWNVVEGLPEVHQRLRNVVILNQSAVEVIKKQDGLHTLFYCDPPYLHETRSTTGEYAHEMSIDQHRELLDTLAGIEGKFMLSGYPSELYEEYRARHGWRCLTQEIDNKAASGKQKEIKIECLWCNFEPST